MQISVVCDAYEDRIKYDHPIWKDFLKSEIKGGHGGMDYST